MRILIISILMLLSISTMPQTKSINGDSLYNRNIFEKGYITKEIWDKIRVNYYIGTSTGDTLAFPLGDYTTGIKTLKDTTKTPAVDSTLIPILSLKDIREITKSLDFMPAKDWLKICQAIDRVYFRKINEGKKDAKKD